MLVVLLAVAGIRAPLHAQPPPGHLVIIGGGSRPAVIMQLIARLAGGAKGKMLVFPQASALPETGPVLAAEFTALWLGRVVVIGATELADHRVRQRRDQRGPGLSRRRDHGPALRAPSPSHRLISLVLEQPALLGVAVDEETATWVKPDRTFEVVGNGPVLVIRPIASARGL